MMLRTTRERDVERLVDIVKRKRRLGRAPNGESLRQDNGLVPTTLFDFAWRMRRRITATRRCSMSAPLAPAGRGDYAASIRTFTGATMFLFAAFVSQKARALVTDAAVHFASRDRSQIADQVIVPRLKVLGLL